MSESLEDESVSDPEPVSTKRANIEALETNDEEKVVSRLLGRMSNQAEPTPPQEFHQKKNVFMSTNDLSLSPPKENRLAAMIAVLGGPSKSTIVFNKILLKIDIKGYHKTYSAIRTKN